MLWKKKHASVICMLLYVSVKYTIIVYCIYLMPIFPHYDVLYILYTYVFEYNGYVFVNIIVCMCYVYVNVGS